MASVKPKVPDVSAATWQELLAETIRFRELEPWKWMDDIHVVGIQDQNTQKVRMATVFGAARQVYGLMVFRGGQGLRFLLGLMWDHLDVDDPMIGLSRDALGVDFGPKSALDEIDRRLYKQLGFAPSRKGARGWPCFRSYMPGFFPWHLEQAEAEQLIADLRLIIDFALLFRAHPGFYENRGERELPFYFASAPYKGGLRMEDLKWHQVELAPLPAPAPCRLNDDVIAELGALPQERNADFELDSFFQEIVIGDGPRPYFPRLALLVDSTTGYILGQHMGTHAMTLEESAAECLVAGLRTAGCRPARLFVSRENLSQALEAVCKRLHIPIFLVSSLPSLQAAQDDITGFFSRRRPM